MISHTFEKLLENSENDLEKNKAFGEQIGSHTILSKASCEKKPNFIKILLKHGDAISRLSNDATPLILSAERGLWMNLKVMREHNENKLTKALKIQDCCDVNPLLF